MRASYTQESDCCPQVQTHAKGNRVQRILRAPRVGGVEAKTPGWLNLNPSRKPMVFCDVGRAGSEMPGLKDTMILPVGSRRGLVLDQAAHHRLLSGRRDFICRAAHAQDVGQPVSGSARDVRDEAGRRVRASKEGRIRHRVGNSQIEAGSQPREAVIEIVAPIDGGVPGAEAGRLITRRSRAGQS